MGEDDANPTDSDANGEYEDNALAGRMNDDTDAEQVQYQDVSEKES